MSGQAEEDTKKERKKSVKLRKRDEDKDIDTSLNLYRAFLSILSIIAGFVFAFVSSQLFSYDTLNERQTWAITFLVPSLGLLLLVSARAKVPQRRTLRDKSLCKK